MTGSLVYLFFANQLAFGVVSSPKAGFLPVLAGTAGVVLSLALLIGQLGKAKLSAPERIDWTKFIFIIIGFIFYVMALNIIGYLAATFIFLVYLFKVADTAGWTAALILAAGSSLVLYWLFDSFLAVTLP